MNEYGIAIAVVSAAIVGFVVGDAWRTCRQIAEAARERKEARRQSEIDDIKRDIHDVREQFAKHLAFGAGHK